MASRVEEEAGHPRITDQHDDDGFALCVLETTCGEGFRPGVSIVDAAAVYGDDRSADMLRDSSRLAGGDVGLANGIEQTGLAVVNVAHDGDYRGPRLEIFFLLFLGDFLDDFFFEGDDVDDSAESFGEAGCRGHVQGLINGVRHRDRAIPSEHPWRALFSCFLGKIADGDAFGNGDFARRTRHEATGRWGEWRGAR